MSRRRPAAPTWSWKTATGLLLCCVVLAACGSSAAPEFGRGSLRIQTSKGPVDLDVRTAGTAEARAQGLMGQTRLPEDAGVVFVSEQPTTAAFWMKNTRIPLSVAFWNSRHEIVDMLDMSPCAADPCPLYRSSSPYVGAVEVNRGFFADRGVQTGDRIQLHADVSF